MNSANYTLQLPTIDTNVPITSSYSISAFSGSTDLRIDIIGDDTSSVIKKIVYSFNDSSETYILQFPLFGESHLPVQHGPFIVIRQPEGFSRKFYSTLQDTTVYTISLSCFRETFVIDTFTLTLSVNQVPLLSAFDGLSLVDAVVFDNNISSGNILLTCELNSTRQLCQFVIPSTALSS